MVTVTIMQGLPASGKSTYAKGLDAWRFNMDEYRAMMGLTWENWTPEREKPVFSAMIEGIRSAVHCGYDVVIDNTHLNPNWPKVYRKEFAQEGVRYEVVSFMDVSLEECIKRDAARADNPSEASVGEEVIRKLHKRYRDAARGGWRLTAEWMNELNYVAPEPYDTYDPEQETIIICDIDGTVADHNGHRGPYDYGKVHLDRQRGAVVNLVDVLSECAPVFFMSGREEGCRGETELWLEENVFRGAGDHLFMRKTNDHRPDWIVKKELFDEHVRGKYNVWFVLDDRDQVVRLWRDLGLDCFQVNYGDF